MLLELGLLLMKLPLLSLFLLLHFPESALFAVSLRLRLEGWHQSHVLLKVRAEVGICFRLLLLTRGNFGYMFRACSKGFSWCRHTLLWISCPQQWFARTLSTRLFSSHCDRKSNLFCFAKWSTIPLKKKIATVEEMYVRKYINLKSELNRHFSNVGDTADVFYADHTDKLISLIHNSAHLAVLLLQPHLVCLNSSLSWLNIAIVC